MRFIIFLFGSMLMIPLYANESALSSDKNIGNLENLKGLVEITKDGATENMKADKGMSIRNGDLVRTATDATVQIKLINGSSIVLDASSSIHFTNINNAEQQSGTITYNMVSQTPLHVQTPSSELKIDGNTAITIKKDVEKTAASSEETKKSSFGATALVSGFSLYKKRLESTLSSYSGQQQIDYEDYFKKFSEQKEDVVNAFDANANNKTTSAESSSPLPEVITSGASALVDHISDIAKVVK
ncbi:FecR family protein [bacterium]|nr:FecR family protein [bacterium]MBU1884945.1 FecR family protein [bacterium]